MHTPLFPACRARLAALGHRTAAPLRQGTLQQLARHLADLIPGHLLSSADEGPNSRERRFPLRLTCECFLWQMLKPRTACREVVRQVQALACLQGQRSVDENASAYIQARQRLPQACLERVLTATAHAAERRTAGSSRLQGPPVKVVDGSSRQLPDTAANQQAYPQPSGQKPGCGFPVLKLAVLFSLASGALLAVVSSKRGSVYEVITERILLMLEKGTVPWQKPRKVATGLPRNLIFLKPYCGMNVLLLHAMNYESPFWLIFRQAKELGGSIKKGEKACPVIFGKRQETEDEITGEKSHYTVLRLFDRPWAVF
jgi:hypothetical protein